MALRGTLKDFGIAEIFQLIGGQGKSGTLFLESKKDKLTLLFDRGSIVGVEPGKERAGTFAELIVRAELATSEQMRDVLAQAKKAMRPITDILREQSVVKPAVLQEMTILDTNEALYGLFAWQDGTYRFEPGDVSYDSTMVRSRSLEQLVMEGFRRIDEWPIIERRLGSRDACFEVVAPLPPRETNDEVGPAERRVFTLVAPDHDVQRIIDLSRIGEFETCRALTHLLDMGYLRLAQKGKGRRSRSGGLEPRWRVRLGSAFVVKGALALVVVAGLALALSFVKPDLSWLLRAPTEGTVGVAEPRALLGNAALARLRDAVRVYEIENGKAPDRLDDLVAAHLITADELTYPWDEPYVYTAPGMRPRGAPAETPILKLADIQRPLR